jgi:hypothetical protein
MRSVDMDEIINECLDLEAEGRDLEALALIRRGVAEHPGFGSRLAATRGAVAKLRQPVFVPESREKVLDEVDYLRPFLSPKRRRQLSASRVAVAAGVVMTLSVMGILQRYYPEATSLSTDPAPVGEVVSAARADASASVRSIVSAVDELRAEVAKPVTGIMGGPMRRPHFTDPLAFGDVSGYDSPSKWRTELAGVGGPSGAPLMIPLATRSEPLLASGPAVLPFGSGPLLLGRSPLSASVRVQDDSMLAKDGELLDYWPKGEFRSSVQGIR